MGLAKQSKRFTTKFNHYFLIVLMSFQLMESVVCEKDIDWDNVLHSYWSSKNTCEAEGAGSSCLDFYSTPPGAPNNMTQGETYTMKSEFYSDRDTKYCTINCDYVLIMDGTYYPIYSDSNVEYCTNYNLVPADCGTFKEGHFYGNIETTTVDMPIPGEIEMTCNRYDDKGYKMHCMKMTISTQPAKKFQSRSAMDPPRGTISRQDLGRKISQIFMRPRAERDQ